MPFVYKLQNHMQVIGRNKLREPFLKQTNLLLGGVQKLSRCLVPFYISRVILEHHHPNTKHNLIGSQCYRENQSD